MESTAHFLRNHFYTKNLPHLAEDQQAAYNLLRARIFDEIEPQNAVEHEVFEQLVHASWQLDRARSLEDNMLFKLTDEPNHPQFKKDFIAFQRARRSLESTQNSALRELRRLISTRILAVAVDCHTLMCTETDAKVPALFDLRQALPKADLRPNRNILSMSLARLKNPEATFRTPEQVIQDHQEAA